MYVVSKGKISQNCVAFSKYMNFITKKKSLGTDFNQENWMLVIRLYKKFINPKRPKKPKSQNLFHKKFSPLDIIIGTLNMAPKLSAQKLLHI